MDKKVTKKPLGRDDAAEFEAAVREGMAEADADKLIPYERIRRWLLSWGSDAELPPPKK